MRTRITASTVFAAALLCAGEVANNVDFQPVFTTANGLELHVQNYTKLPKTLARVDVFIGGSADLAACRVALPGVVLAPAASTSVLVADADTINSCLPLSAPVRISHRLAGLEDDPDETGRVRRAPLQFERSVRIVPHFTGALQQLRFRFAD